MAWSGGNGNGRNKAASACYVACGSAGCRGWAWESRWRTACRQCGQNIPNKYHSKDVDNKVKVGGQQHSGDPSVSKGAPPQAPGDGADGDRIAKLEQVSKLLTQAGYADDDAMVRDAQHRLEAARAERLDSKPAWVKHKNTAEKLQRRKEAFMRLGLDEKQADVAAEIAKLQADTENMVAERPELHLEVSEMEEEVRPLGTKLAERDQSSEGTIDSVPLPQELQGLSNAPASDAALAAKLEELRKVAKEATDMAEQAKVKQAEAAAAAEAETAAAAASAPAGGAPGPQLPTASDQPATDPDQDMADAEALDRELDGHLVALLGGDGVPVTGDEGEGDDPKKAASEQIRGMLRRLRTKRPTPYG